MLRILLVLVILIAGVLGGGAFYISQDRGAQEYIADQLIFRLANTTSPLAERSNKLRIHFCGTASPMPSFGRAQSCIAVIAGDHFFVVDAGARSADRLGQSGLPLQELDGVLLTHFHSDHIAALGEINLATWVRGRQYNLPVFGGAGIDRVVGGFNLAYELDSDYRTAHHGEEILPHRFSAMYPRQIALDVNMEAVIYDRDGMRITAFAVDHEPIHPALGYKFEYEGQVVVISGDTKLNEKVEEMSVGADLLIHEVLEPNLVDILSENLAKAGRNSLSTLITDTLDYHTYPADIERLAERAGVPRVVFYHFAPYPSNPLFKIFYTRNLSKSFRSEDLIFADDGMTLEFVDRNRVEVW